MIDLTMVAIAAFVVGVLYVVLRMTQGKSVNTMDIIKFGGVSGGITAGVLYFMENGNVSTVTEAAQDMFVGKPSF
jgi:hypothetical protein